MGKFFKDLAKELLKDVDVKGFKTSLAKEAEKLKDASGAEANPQLAAAQAAAGNFLHKIGHVLADLTRQDAPASTVAEATAAKVEETKPTLESAIKPVLNQAAEKKKPVARKSAAKRTARPKNPPQV